MAPAGLTTELLLVNAMLCAERSSWHRSAALVIHGALRLAIVARPLLHLRKGEVSSQRESG